MTEPLIDKEHAKAFFGDVTDKWIYARTSSGELPHYKIGGLLRFKASELAAYAERCQRGQR
jgi:excisionase family DNA binding protein